MRVAQYSLVVIHCSGTNVRLGLDLSHGPNGMVYDAHSTPIDDWAPGNNPPVVKVGDADPSKVLGEWLRSSLKIRSAAQTAESAVVEVWETWKPF